MKFTYISDAWGEWYIYFLDGKYVGEGHSIRWDDILTFMGVEIENIDIDVRRMEYMAGYKGAKSVEEIVNEPLLI